MRAPLASTPACVGATQFGRCAARSSGICAAAAVCRQRGLDGGNSRLCRLRCCAHTDRSLRLGLAAAAGAVAAGCRRRRHSGGDGGLSRGSSGTPAAAAERGVGSSKARQQAGAYQSVPPARQAHHGRHEGQQGRVRRRE